MSSHNSYVVILLVSTAILAGVCYGQDIATGSVINSGVTIDENGVTIGGSTPSFSGPPLTFECPAGCISQSYSPVIFTSEVAISTLQNSCTCMGCPSGGIVQCTFYQDGKKLEPTDTVLAAVAASAQSTTPAGGTSTTDVISESNGSMLAVWAGIGSVLLLI
eukprot:CAMPEP_0118803258 /NCGR_PEP_ID=MMETSP1161-20130426/15822_1 /TAXON_ID=249345 /ORGANISM="Picochlorum oklahomensis, Strain CCMP2329" /LENGTH=161 /DNA_ID=CAMNT_0006731721 /DNA_START=125 /DNA_END=610 /DNA_ORIENTATION=-